MPTVLRILLSLLLLPFLAQAQSPTVLPGEPSFTCATMEMQQSRPDLLLKQQQLEEAILAKKDMIAAEKPGSLPFQIPVVVHIIHQNGVENITDAQVFAAIEHLNQAFAQEGYFSSQGNGAPTQIQFCLALRDPDGNTSNGITRTESPLTNMVMETQDIQTKDLNRWKPKDYVNIWVVKEITSNSSGPGVAGYAFFPSSHGNPEDGMVCEAKYFGVSAATDAILIHEMGHYLGLYHTFEGGCLNDDCAVQGDRICDTPPDVAVHTACSFNSCSTDVAPGSPFLVDVSDFTGDFMDYSPFSCYGFFTAGQAARMQGVIATTRASLLDSKVCLDPCTVQIVAAFAAQPNPVLAGQPVLFTNNSIGATNFSWSENGVVFSQDQDPVQVFATVGIHPIQLTATNDDPKCRETAEVSIAVGCPVQASFTSDTLAAILGSTLVFTNTSQGGNNLGFEWRINNQLVSSAIDLSYLFQNPGLYEVNLTAIATMCRMDTSVWVFINGPCAQIPEPVQLSFTSSQKYFISRDLYAHPDGSVLHCGSQKQRPMVTKWDEQGNVLWHRVMDLSGSFNQIESTADGNYLLVGIGNLKMLVAKIDGNGNFLWSKTLQNTGSNYFPNSELSSMLAVNPDGSFGLYYSDNYGSKHYLVKISAAGDVLWTRKFSQIGSHNSLQRATDGSGDFLLLSAGKVFSADFTMYVYRISQTNGASLNSISYQFPNEDLQQLSNIELTVHPDGGFSFFWVKYSDQLGTATHKYLAEFTESGSVIWANKYRLPTAYTLENSFIRQLPNNNGWFMIDSRTKTSDGTKSNYMQRIDRDGNIAWERKWGDVSLSDDWVSMPVWRSGRVRGVNTEGPNDALRLMHFPDSKLPITCLPLLQANTIVETVLPNKYPFFGFTNPASLTLADMPVVLAPYVLSKSELCSAILPCPEICDNQIDDDGDFFVDCFDDDCNCAPMNQSECYVDPDSPDFSIKLGWESGDSMFIFHTAVPLVANLNPQTDSIPEIIIAGWSGTPSVATIYFFKGDGSDKNTPKKMKIPGVLQWLGPTSMAISDLNRDGIPEVIALCEDKKIRIFTQFDPSIDPPMQLWATSTESTKYAQGVLSVADFDADGVPEIYIGSQIFKLTLNPPNAPSLNLVLSGNAGNGFSSAGTSQVSSTAADMLSVADCGGDPDCAGIELVAGTSIYSIDLSTTDGDGMQIKEKANLNQVDPSSLVFSDGFAGVADVNLDGIPDVVLNTNHSFGTSYKNGVAVWNKQGLQRFYPTNNVAGYYGSGGQILIANVFDDREAGFAQDMPEILVLCQYKLFCFNENKASKTPVTPWWWTLTMEEQSGRTSATAFDFNGDGILEIVYRDEQALQIIYGGAPPFPKGVNSHRKWAVLASESSTGDEYPVVADLDNDNQAEIAVSGMSQGSGGTYFARLRIFEGADKPWLPARPVWNQYNYFNVNINDDLTVPVNQQNHWTEAPGPGSGKRPFNTYQVQGPTTDSILVSRVKVPDADLLIKQVSCYQDSLEISLEICNSGSADLPAGTPIAFYLGDPTSTVAPLLFPPPSTPDAVAKGGCLDWALRIPATYNAQIFAVINDNGTLPRPFQLEANFPSTQLKECYYENNMTSFSLQHQVPTLDLGPNLSLCKSSVVELIANAGFNQYRWQDGSTNQKFTAFTPGAYWVAATDACGFTQTDTVTIELNTIAVLDLPETQTICAGEKIQLAASGFSQYTWFPADSLSCSDCAEVEVLATQTITIYLTAAEGECFVSDSVRIIIAPVPQLSLQMDLIPCEGGSGKIVAISSGGGGQYGFDWSTGEQTDAIEVFLPGEYAVTLSDFSGSGCSVADTVLVTTRGEIHLETASETVSCYGGMDGVGHAFPVDGTPPYAWLWQGGQTDSLLNDLAAGSYFLTITDAIGCTGAIEVAVSEPHLFQAMAQVEDSVVCPGATTTIASIVDGGTPPYFFLWSNGQTDSLLLSAEANAYGLTVTDSHDCTITTSANIYGAPILAILLDSIDHASGPAQGDGSIFVHISSGAGPFSFLWSNGDTSQNLLSIFPGDYTLTVTDGGGCTQTLSAQVDFVLTTGQLPASEWMAFLQPNPTQQGNTTSLVITSSTAQEISFQLFDAIGRLLQEEKITLMGDRFSKSLKAPAAPGVYWVMLRSGRELRWMKWVVV